MKRYTILLLLLAIGGGCSPAAQPVPRPTESEIFAGTVGSLCELSGYSSVRVQGYSLVVGLTGTGSSECPEPIKGYLVQQLRRLKEQGYLPDEYLALKAHEIIASRDTAVVMVSGLIPAGAPKSERFEIEVSILPATQTTSLQGGWLIRSELQIVLARQSGRLVAGRPSALAAGPIFINPFPQDQGKTADPRRGIVLGGGRSLYNRQIQLSILRPDYRMAQQIQRRINARFKAAEGAKVADAIDRSRVLLTVPDEYQDRYSHFISLIWALYLQDSPGYEERMAGKLNKLALQDDADYEAIALAWEGIGRNISDDLYKIYHKDHKSKLAFYAAKTALNLDDRKAIDALIKMARDSEHPAQLGPVKALSHVADDARARKALRELVSSSNPQLRFLAYEGLRRVSDAAISSMSLPGGFTLDIVQAAGDRLVCVWARKKARIVIFGQALRCRDNVFYESANGHVQINVPADAMEISITRKLPHNGKTTTLKCPLTVEALIKNLAWSLRHPKDGKVIVRGLSFSEIAGILYQLCQEEAIPAQFILQREN